MSVFIHVADKDTAKLYIQFFQTKITQNLNISARMSWSLPEILKQFKKLAVAYYQVKNSSPQAFKPDNTLPLVFQTWVL